MPEQHVSGTSVVIPSRKRTFKVARMRQFFPDAIWWVHESEGDSYLEAGVPADQLWPHTSPPPFASVVNGLLDEVERRALESVAVVDDDLEGVWAIPSSRELAPEEVRALIDNMARLLQDTGLGFGAFPQDQSLRIYGAKGAHFGFIGSVSQLMVLRGNALKQRYRLDMGIGPDLDWSLRALLDERIIICDKRFVVTCANTFTGPGGNTGIITNQDQAEANNRYIETWGSACSVTEKFRAPKMGGKVRRSNPRAPKL